MSDPAVRIVTLTVTEKGYCHDPATCRLDEGHPDIRHDLANPRAPRSAPGFLVEALARRRAEGVAPFTVVSCDNLPSNGATARNVLTRMASLRDAGFGAWVAGDVAFPSTMVDRIVPATTDEDRARIAARLGAEDAWPIVTEPFSQWVIEDRFPTGRPRFEDSGATLVSDVAPFELAKLRLLNGSHSTLAYLGYLAGYETVSGRVGVWRGGFRLSMSVAAPFVWRCLSGSAVVPFPHPPHRTGRADFPHPALGQDLTPSSTARRAQAGSDVRARSARRGARVDSSRPFAA